MKIKRFLSAAAATLLTAAMLTGCSAGMKTAKVAAKFGSALKNQPITSATAEISAGVTAISQGIPSESKFRTLVKSRSDWEAHRSYSDITTTMTLLGTELAQTMQCYTSGESGESVRYVHVDTGDVWLRLQDQKRVVDIDPELIMLLLDKVSQDTTMEIQENTVGGTGSYVLGLCFTAEDIRAFAESADLTIPEEFADIDLQGVTIPVELEIEDKTFLPLRLQIQVKGINRTFTQALAKSFAQGGELEGVEVRMEDISFLVTNFAYGPQDIPMLPKGAAENALDMEKIKEIQNS